MVKKVKKPVKKGQGVVSPDPNFPKKGPSKPKPPVKETAKVFPGSF